jgi:hypothetical protein
MSNLDYSKGFITAGAACGNNLRALGGLWRMTFAVLICAASLSASIVTISASGTFASGTASSTFSAPDETWAFSFEVDSNPAVSNVDLGNYFDVDFSDFTYSLDGSAVAITPADIRFYSLSQFGGFSICFTTACSFFNSPTDGIEVQGSQMYTGSESAPTMSTGTFTSTYLDAYVDTVEYNQPPHQTITAAAVATPEPSTIPTIGAGLLLALAVRRLRRRAVPAVATAN